MGEAISSGSVSDSGAADNAGENKVGFSSFAPGALLDRLDAEITSVQQSYP